MSQKRFSFYPTVSGPTRPTSILHSAKLSNETTFVVYELPAKVLSVKIFVVEDICTA